MDEACEVSVPDPVCSVRFAAGGCQPMADEEKPLEEGEYLVYYLDSSTTRLAPQPYRPQAKDADGIIAELMEQFQEVPADVDSQRRCRTRWFSRNSSRRIRCSTCILTPITIA